MNRPILAAFTLLSIAGLSAPLNAQEPAPAAAPASKQPAPSLKAGDPAPAFKVHSILKGAEFAAFESGKIYVVEFWSTWCGPCIASMPHLSKLQAKFADKGVRIVGVNIWEDDKLDDATLSKVRDFVTQQGDIMGYTVAYDGPDKHMDKAWMQAAGRRGIPSAFLVDGTGKIAWMGHPIMLDIVLHEVVDGTWDYAQGPAKITAARKQFEAAIKAYEQGLEAGDAAWNEAMKSQPLLEPMFKTGRYEALISHGHIPRAVEMARTMVDEGTRDKDQETMLAFLAPFLESGSVPEGFDRELIVKGVDAGAAIGDQSQPGPSMVRAQGAWLLGDAAKAREHAAKALELAKPEQREAYQRWITELENKFAKK